MGRLKDFKAYLDGRHSALAEAEYRLCALQSKYEDHFAEVSRVREAELGQLTEHTLNDRSVLPEWFNRELDSTQAEVERELDAKLAELEEGHARLLAEAEGARARSLAAEKKVKETNRALDDEEEALKERNRKLLDHIEEYNRRIRTLGRGFGFFWNFFKMRHLARYKTELDTEARDVAARIETLRSRWQSAEAEHAAREEELRRTWVELETDAAALATKLESLRQNRSRLVTRSTLERVLDAQSRVLPEPAEGDPSCGRCKAANPSSNHFCRMCARRLGGDREDFDGSLEEISELNTHFTRFSAGMEACQEIIGLVRGLKSGVENFLESVVEMQSSERKYPLPKLEISVPSKSLEYGAVFDRLKEAAAQDFSLHPLHFAGQVKRVVGEILTEERIQAYFEEMGEELSRQAASQWE